MDPKSLASEIISAGDRVLEKDPKRVDDALANTVIKQGANALKSGASKGAVDPAIGAAAEVSRSRTSASGLLTDGSWPLVYLLPYFTFVFCTQLTSI